MYAVSDAFKAEIVKSHKPAGLVSVAGVPLVVDPAQSSVNVDRTAAVRRTCTMVCMDPTGTLTPGDAGTLLHPLSGNEFTVSRGVQYDDGTQELVPQGVFGIKASKVDDTGPELRITLTGADRSDAMSRAKLTNVYPIGGLNLATALQALFSSRVPSTQFNFPALPYVTPSGLVLPAGADPWAEGETLADAAGCSLFYDAAAGVCTLLPFPDPTTSPISWVYAEGPSCTVTGGARNLTRVGVFSHTVREGVSTGTAPVRGEWMDTNPLSPTYWQGKYQDVVDYKASSLYTSDVQAQAAAQADGLESLGLSETVALTIFPNPAHSPLDVVQVMRSRLNVAFYYVLDSFVVPMSYANDMPVTARRIAR